MYIHRINPLAAVALLVILLGVLWLCICYEPAEAVIVPKVYTVNLPLVVNEFDGDSGGCDDSIAPEYTFTDVGDVAYFSGFNGISGKAVVAGLQTLMIIGFYAAGDTEAEIWLAKWPDLETPVHKLGTVDMRVYAGEYMMYHIPCWLTPGSVDFIVVYGTGPYIGVLAAAQFN